MRPLRWMFASRVTGRIVVAQWPNPALWVVIAAALVRVVAHPRGTAGSVVHWVGLVATVVWALDEVVRGVNPWRRALGVAVLVSSVT